MYYFCSSCFHLRFLCDTLSEHHLLGICTKFQLYRGKSYGLFWNRNVLATLGLFAGVFFPLYFLLLTLPLGTWSDWYSPLMSRTFPNPATHTSASFPHRLPPRPPGPPAGLFLHRFRRAGITWQRCECRLCLDFTGLGLQAQVAVLPSVGLWARTLPCDIILVLTNKYQI